MSDGYFLVFWCGLGAGLFLGIVGTGIALSGLWVKTLNRELSKERDFIAGHDIWY